MTKNHLVLWKKLLKKNELLEPESHQLSCLNEHEHAFLFLEVAQRESQQAYREFCKDSGTKH